MYTQCPECQTAFRVTVEVLQKAGGRVRCGGCSHAFSALDHLSDKLPGSASNSSSNESSKAQTEGSREEFDAKSKALLETLDELAGPHDVRIEDTGVEWRVLDEDETGTQSTLELRTDESNSASEDEQSAAAAERRYDDNTQLPDDFAEEEDVPFVPETPGRRETDVDEPETDFDTHQVDMALEDDDTWAELLDDGEEAGDPGETGTASRTAGDLTDQLEAAEAQQIADDSALLPQLAAGLGENLQPEAASSGADIPFEIEEELAAIHSDLTAVGKSDEPDDTAPSDLDTQFNLQAEALGLDVTQNEALDSSDTEDAAPEEAPQEEIPEDAEDEHDELSAEEEADIVQKLRDSTGSFKKQIEAAQQALDRGDVDEYQVGRNEQADDADQEEPADKPDEDEGKDDGAVYESDQESQHVAEDDLSHRDTFSRTMIQAGLDPSAVDTGIVETIIMEGEFVGSATGDEPDSTSENQSIAGLDQQQRLVDTYMLNKEKARRRMTDPRSYPMLAGIAALTLLLIAQLMHASRQTFATYGAFNQTLGPVYRALGSPVTPSWNIKGWQFEQTRGSTDDNDEVLTVFSRVRNNSEDPLPYPLIHVSLTDRWEDIIGSKILEPSEYLAGDLDPRTPVAPGDSFTAVIAIERPATDATGFQLYVCYRVSPGRVRCATEDFKS